MIDTRILEEAIKIINKYLRGQVPKTKKEINNAKEIKEYLNSMMYKKDWLYGFIQWDSKQDNRTKC